MGDFMSQQSLPGAAMKYDVRASELQELIEAAGLGGVTYKKDPNTKSWIVVSENKKIAGVGLELTDAIMDLIKICISKKLINLRFEYVSQIGS